MDSNTQKEAMPKLCAAGCGFFSNPNLDDLCSKCNRERQANEAAAKAIASSAPPAAVAAPQPPAPVLQPLQPTPTSQPTEQPPAPVQALPALALSPTAAPVPPPVSQPLAAAATAAAAEPKLLDANSAAAAAAAAADSGGQQQQAAEEAADDEPPRRVQKNTNRCFSCNKKVGLTGFKCRCGFVFCGPHRLAEAHDCDYDYKGAGRETLAKLNPLVQADRVTRF